MEGVQVVAALHRAARRDHRLGGDEPAEQTTLTRPRRPEEEVLVEPVEFELAEQPLQRRLGGVGHWRIVPRPALGELRQHFPPEEFDTRHNLLVWQAAELEPANDLVRADILVTLNDAAAGGRAAHGIDAVLDELG